MQSFLKLVLTFFILVTFTSSCDKDDQNNSLTGTWKATIQEIFMDGELYFSIEENDLNDFVIQLNADYSIVWTENNFSRSGTYETEGSTIKIDLENSDHVIMEYEYYFENSNLVIEFSYTESSGETTVVKTTFRKL